MSISESSRMCYEILAYLDKHPDAQDTMDGIVNWWLLEQHIERQIEGVKEALDELVAMGLVEERKGENLRVHYRINRSKTKAVRAQLKQWTDDE